MVNKQIPSEYREQCLIFEWARTHEKTWPQLKFIYATLNGVRLPIGLAVKAKKQGNKPGVPDIDLPYNNGVYTGLHIELKKIRGGKVSVCQKKYLAFLNAQGRKAVVCKGANEAINIIKEYLTCAD